MVCLGYHCKAYANCADWHEIAVARAAMRPAGGRGDARLCEVGAKAVQGCGMRLFAVRVAPQRSAQQSRQAKRARDRCSAAALLCTDVLLPTLESLPAIIEETQHE
jgi:hypothetical protein